MVHKSLMKLTKELIADLHATPDDQNLIVLSMRLAFIAGQKEILNEMTRRAAR